MRVGWAVTTSMVACLVSSCGRRPVFECDGDDSCGPNGHCEPVGYCSFPDADCPSGRRFGDLASSELANTCVGAGDPTGESGGSTLPNPSTSSPSTVTTADASTTTGGLSSATASTSTSTTSGGSSTDASSSSGGSTLDDGLILHWPLEDDFATMAGSVDASGNDLHAQCEVCPASVPGRVGMAAGFDADAVLYVPDAPLLRPPEAFSVSLWALDADPTSGVTQFLIGKVIAAQYNTFQISTSPPDVGMVDEMVWRLTDEGPTNHQIYVANPLDATRWRHLAGVWDGSTSTLWIDGEVVASVPAPAVDWDAGPFCVGADNNDGFLYWYRGTIDEVRFYDRALTDEEVLELASP